jgi:putative salt-induced outer membrane protein YdiY
MKPLTNVRRARISKAPVLISTVWKLVFCVTILTQQADAQTASGAATEAEKAADAVNGPNAPAWTGTLTAGGQIDSGRLFQRALTITSDNWWRGQSNTLRFEAGETYGSIQASGTRITSANNQDARFSWNRTIAKRLYYLMINSEERDTIRKLEHRETSVSGLGIRLFEGPKLFIDIIPGGALVNQNKDLPRVNGVSFDAGLFYALSYKINERWQATNWFTIRSNVADSQDITMDGFASLNGVITKHFGLQVKVTYNYEGLLAPGSIAAGVTTKNYLSTTVGLRYQYGR